MQTKEDYLKQLVDAIEAQNPADSSSLVTSFSSLFWRGATEEDISPRNAADDAGLCIDSWRLFENRSPEDITIRISNPVRSRDGWHSSYTVVTVMARNMPFTVDSILMALSQDGIVTHCLNNVVFAVNRDRDGKVVHLSLDHNHGNRELFIFAEVDRLPDEHLPGLEEKLNRTATDLSAAVSDFSEIKQKLAEISDSVLQIGSVTQEERLEAKTFLDWLQNKNFTFLGFREFDYLDDTISQVGEPLGILRVRNPASTRRLSEQSPSTQEFLLEPSVLSFSKGGRKSLVHRPAYPDYIGIKKFNESGDVIGEYGFLGLYTSRVYMDYPDSIPVIRQKIEHVIQNSEFDREGFDGEVLKQVLARYPRDELFQISEEELLHQAVAVTNFHERRKIKLFVREDRYGLFVNCLIYLPRDLFDTRVRYSIEKLLADAFNAEDTQYDTLLSESILVRLQYILRVAPDSNRSIDCEELERKIATIVNDWRAELDEGLADQFGETRGRELVLNYVDAFSAGYREYYSAAIAVADIHCIEAMSDEQTLNTRLYHLIQDDASTLRLKVFNKGSPLPLSDQVPKLENLGFRITDEKTYQVRRSEGGWITIHDFKLFFETQLDLGAIGALFNESFGAIWLGAAEDDGFNRLILAAGLTWRQVNILRVYARYMKQILFGFSQTFIGDTLFKHKGIGQLLVNYFEARMSPTGASAGYETLGENISSALDEVLLLNEDRVLRRILELMQASLRTNYFQHDKEGAPRTYLSIKFDPRVISDLPLPRPKYEIFVCAPTFEGVHLRGGDIARGGLRWSDRHEDYRTEILGLMKAQVVKNGVIVPTGAKGGFIIKARSGEVDTIGSYKSFISGLLDLTDNREGDKILPPSDTRCHDGFDPYLVVAADKGTATFSDHANAVAAQYEFWLDDAFASGGSNGYDHKKMGITARGAWISVQRHFMERDIDVQRDPISVIAIGDMAGDVFGNGMLRSETLKLVGAFNHMHIFIDPNPDTLLSYQERLRLFNLPRSSWEDYSTSLISAGGGVFSRQAKSIAISHEMQATLDITDSRLSPDELIHQMLKAPVDLLWNGGIGTYVKSVAETADDAGDRANDSIRIDAPELRARVVGEGGNLGMTQLARIEYALAGGAINTDSIDNSAGVNCSDREVNIKILLNGIVKEGDMTTKQRNQLLESLTDDVAKIVLSDSKSQTRSISLAALNIPGRESDYMRFMARMESTTGLDRKVEYLLSDEALIARSHTGQHLTRPELSVLLAYAKIHIKNSLASSNISQDPAVAREALRAFPSDLRKRYEPAILTHSLLKEIVASQLANTIIDSMGITFVAHHMEFVGGKVDQVARAFLVFANVFDIREWIEEIDHLEGIVESTKQNMLLELMRLGRHCTRWILRHRRELSDLQILIDHYKPIVGELMINRDKAMSKMHADDWTARVTTLEQAGVPLVLAKRTAAASQLTDIFLIIDASDKTGTPPLDVAMDFVELSQALSIDSLVEEIYELPTVSHWQTMERNALVDNIKMIQGTLAGLAITTEAGNVAAWLENHPDFTSDWHDVINEAFTSTDQDLSMYSMTCRKLQDLCNEAGN